MFSHTLRSAARPAAVALTAYAGVSGERQWRPPRADDAPRSLSPPAWLSATARFLAGNWRIKRDYDSEPLRRSMMGLGRTSTGPCDPERCDAAVFLAAFALNPSTPLKTSRTAAEGMAAFNRLLGNRIWRFASACPTCGATGCYGAWCDACEVLKLEEEEHEEAEAWSAVADDWRAPVFSKTPEEEAALRQLLKNHVLLQGTKDADIDIVLGAFQGLRFLRGAAIITQGELGDNFYVLESGACDIWVQREGGARERVMRATPGTSFGELALLYDSPRAASVVATERCKCWALDRETFKRILMGNAVRRNARYEAFLDNVPCLQQLGRYEKLKLTDALRSQSVAAGDAVVREGTYGNDFYIIEEGEVRVTKPSRGPVEVCRRLGPSDFFGERALLSTEKRAATVTAVKPTQLLVLDRESFLRLLGPLEGILSREMQGYIEAASSSDDDFR